MAKVRELTPALLTGGGMLFKCVRAAAVCFAAVLISAASLPVQALPIRGPDLHTCTTFSAGRSTGITDKVDCCLIVPRKAVAKDFEFNLDLPMRVRRPAHKLDEEYIRKYERAVELMKALPPEDPRSYIAQANVHCAYSGHTYAQFNSTGYERHLHPDRHNLLNVHHGWLFLPYHRWFVYFHERTLASLLGDDTFALPYWAWDVQLEDNPPANVMPAAYVRKNSSLYNEKRHQSHLPPRRIDLERHSPDNKTDDELIEDNSYIMWAMMIGDVKTPEVLYGQRYCYGDDNNVGDAIFEATAHNALHPWVGNPDLGGMDMTNLWSAAREPMFYTHHAQMDRLWAMWKNWGGRDLTDPDWLNAEFVLYDENGDLVRVNVRDSLNLDNFRYTYEQVDPDWLDYKPRSIRDIDPKYVKAGRWKRFVRQVLALQTYSNIANGLVGYFQPEEYGPKVSFGGVERAVVTSPLSMPEVIQSSSDASSVYDEVLVIAGVVEKPFDVDVRFNIFLQLPEADESTPRNCVEFLGTVAVDGSVEDSGTSDRTHPTVVRKFKRTMGIGERLQILDIVPQMSVTITFVPAWDQKHDPDVSVRVTDLMVERKLVR